jgi:hypothetical protein
MGPTPYVLRRVFEALPGELETEFGAALKETLRRRIAHAFAAAERMSQQAAAFHRVSLPAKPAPEPPEPVLAYYRQYVLGSTSGETEVVSGEEQIGTPEWLRLHPSVSFEQSFEISRRKKEWDGRMAELLRERPEWDLPAEVIVSPAGDIPFSDD